MNGATMKFNKQHMAEMDQYIKEYQPFKKGESLNIDLPALVRYCKEKGLDTTKLTEDDIKPFRIIPAEYTERSHKTSEDYAKGRLSAFVEMVKDGTLDIADAAKKLGMSEGTFRTLL